MNMFYNKWKTGSRRFRQLLLLLLCSLSANVAMAQFFTEDFDGANTTVMLSLTGDCVGDNDDYFGVLSETSPTNLNVDYGNDDGNFLGAQDTDGGGCGNGTGNDDVSALLDDIPISGQTGITLCFDLAEADASNGEEDWDAASSVSIAYSIDGASFETVLVMEAAGGTNTMPQADCDNDGLGDGDEIGNDFSTFCFPVSGTGTFIDLQFNISGLDAGDEDVAIDNIQLYSNESSGTPPDGAGDGCAPPPPPPGECSMSATVVSQN
ncbi:MAG: hypothetical protein AAFO94_10580, partial [Bacteroidota bacterium]